MIKGFENIQELKAPNPIRGHRAKHIIFCDYDSDNTNSLDKVIKSLIVDNNNSKIVEEDNNG